MRFGMEKSLDLAALRHSWRGSSRETRAIGSISETIRVPLFRFGPALRRPLHNYVSISRPTVLHALDLLDSPLQELRLYLPVAWTRLFQPQEPGPSQCQRKRAHL